MKLNNLIKDSQNLDNKWKNGLGKCLEEKEITILIEIGSFLSNEKFDSYFFSSNIYSKLKILWAFIQKIPDSMILEIIAGQNNKNIKDPKVLEKIFYAANTANQIVQDVVDRNYNGDKKYDMLEIYAILLVIIIIADAHEFHIDKIPGRARRLLIFLMYYR